MTTLKIGRSHRARKALFTRGIRRGYLLLEEIDEALPPGSLTDAERWLLFYSLKASHVEVRDENGKRVGLERRPGSGTGPEAEAEVAAEARETLRRQESDYDESQDDLDEVLSESAQH